MFDIALKIIKKIEKHGFKAYIVGGFVRDYYIGNISKDVDICTNAKPETLIEIFPTADTKDAQLGAVNLYFEKGDVTITTFRKETNYFNNRKPDKITYITDVKGDLKRRDFIINTLLMDSDKKLFDYLGAIGDIKASLIRSVGNPNHKMKEDALRILRAFRFMAVLGFTIENKTLLAIKKQKHLLKNISYQRKREEIDKIFTAPNASKTFKLMQELDIFEQLDIKIGNNIVFGNDSIGFWSQVEFSNNYPFSNEEQKKIDIIRKIVEEKSIDRIKLYTYGLNSCLIAGSILKIEKVSIVQDYDNLPIHSPKDVKISFNEILEYLMLDPVKTKNIFGNIIIKILKGELLNRRESIMEFLEGKKYEER